MYAHFMGVAECYILSFVLFLCYLHFGYDLFDCFVLSSYTIALV